MRGKERARSCIFASRGITPACARKRSQGFAVRLSTRDHPRVCGEKRFRSAVRSSSTGSPPRMRGKAAMVAAFASLLRITPAYAGKRTKPAWNWLRARDHPRVCGEKKIAGKTHALASGSPPPVRGKGRISRFGFYHKGITPACAGKSAPLDFLNRTHQDHPRVCGEKVRRTSGSLR